MKITINQYDFAKEFKDYGRENQFTIKALFILFDYFTEYEQETKKEIELDVIAICCEYTEETLKEWAINNNIDRHLGYTELISRLSSQTYIVGDYTNEQGENVVIYQNY